MSKYTISGEMQGYTPAQIEEYRGYIESASRLIEAASKEESA